MTYCCCGDEWSTLYLLNCGLFISWSYKPLIINWPIGRHHVQYCMWPTRFGSPALYLPGHPERTRGAGKIRQSSTIPTRSSWENTRNREDSTGQHYTYQVILREHAEQGRFDRPALYLPGHPERTRGAGRIRQASTIPTRSSWENTRSSEAPWLPHSACADGWSTALLVTNW